MASPRTLKNVQRFLSHWDRDRPASAYRLHSPDKPVRRPHGNTAHCIVAKVLGNLDNKQPAIPAGNMNGIINLQGSLPSGNFISSTAPII